MDKERPVTDDRPVTLTTVPGVSLTTRLEVFARVDKLFQKSVADIANSKKYQTIFLYYKFLFVLFLFIIYSPQFQVPNGRRAKEDTGPNGHRCEA
jgi:hypothetical protein